MRPEPPSATSRFPLGSTTTRYGSCNAPGAASAPAERMSASAENTVLKYTADPRYVKLPRNRGFLGERLSSRAPKLRQRLPQLLERHAELMLDSLLRCADGLACARDEPVAGGRHLEEVR